MAALQDTHPWVAEVIDLKRQGLDTAEIAKAVDKHPATIRKAIAKARERGDLPSDGPQLGEAATAHGAEYLYGTDPETSGVSGVIEGQTTVDDCTTPGNEWINAPARDPLEEFRAEAGEAVGEMQTRPGEEPAGVLDDPDPPLMPGTRQMVLDLGPNAAPVHEATVSFKTERWPSGHFGMGDIVRGTFTARIVDVPAREAFDKDSGEFRAKRKDYGALITEIEYEAVDPGE